jgi:hypothetical protein
VNSAKKERMLKYKDNVDYLVSSIIYLGTHGFYWARSSSNLAAELSVDQDKLTRVFEGFPGLFRRSRRVGPNGQPYYALQARYAQREGGDVADPEEVSYIAPLTVDKLKMLTDFVLESAEAERTSRRANIANAFSTAAAVLAAATAILVALAKADEHPSAAAGASCLSSRPAAPVSTTHP